MSFVSFFFVAKIRITLTFSFKDSISQKSRDSGNASTYGISKITEATNKKMKNFKHHLTTRKNGFRSEISNTFSRIRKSNTVSSIDLSEIFKRKYCENIGWLR